ncbi:MULTISPECIES: xanthine dehydrogenase small subunit [unclassified Paracoccus (in: a-proteobacteria)]|uniref:xanthine dehydrogenase small subunit n=1 Tax=unclassified Paracoccus (in: a-proteobacteria) TaxID=2688777 RepID=UPI001603861A|nr:MULTISPECIES: xanthine dehydrogenase small subunit [unclassified Paracoccus (in: a-proteobacteria)]MBB1492663.1 xanthine dehydrogenase small subunit [Paracoccus sp. MC1854]MBB1499208.1 xanthine dehydrogenase small subunit [Paracoccus sp. MC1862]QQO45022.1 xanthine dehydrogenase small subunit [Paracoccus sp. MC1862]
MIRFLLNDTEIRLTEAGPGDTLLDFLRLGRGLTGTKEGCAEGDCGACTVLVGRLHGGALVYEPVNACIRFLAACHRCHVVTIEHLRGEGGGLHPIQAAMVEHHGSQCGFCTPGFVMALYGLWMTHESPDVVQIETALQGNLCRCTGYEPIVKAALAAGRAGGQLGDFLVAQRAEVTAKLSAMPVGAEVGRGEERAILPADTDELARVLVRHPQATIVAGATDVGLWVTKQFRPISPAVFIGHLMKGIEVDAEEIRIGAGVTYSEFAPVIDDHFPEVEDYVLRIGGWQIRNAGTIGGNIANGSPIGETPPLLIALGARIVLRLGDARRELPLEAFFLDYGRQDRRPGEFVETVVIPLKGKAMIAAYKMSKRQSADISAISAGFRIQVENGTITRARVAFGGLAGIPARAAKAEAALEGQPFTAASFEAAARAVKGDFTPLTDFRATADYRHAVAANFFRRFWLENSGQDVPVRLNRAVGE